MHIKNGWDKPIMITENGIADGSDKNRAQYIISHIQEMESAIKDGAEVLGYMHWSLVDNWELQEGYRSQSNFGLFHVIRNGSDPTINTGQCGNCSREITNGAQAYRYLVSQTGYYQDPDKWEMAISSAKAQFGYFSPDGYALVPPSSPTKSILNSVLGK